MTVWVLTIFSLPSLRTRRNHHGVVKMKASILNILKRKANMSVRKEEMPPNQRLVVVLRLARWTPLRKVQLIW